MFDVWRTAIPRLIPGEKKKPLSLWNQIDEFGMHTTIAIKLFKELINAILSAQRKSNNLFLFKLNRSLKNQKL